MYTLTSGELIGLVAFCIVAGAVIGAGLLIAFAMVEGL